MKIETIDKSEVENTTTQSVNFSNGASVPLPSSIFHLHQQIDRAVRLGNGHKSKVKIFFQTAHGIRMVHTTVWAATENFIILKGGQSIPMDAIMDIIE
ncbi:MAG TPA: hypothetical protein VLZ75_13565 [Chitinophagales bacterium]|nr:hypothetical protein [Chitinophagales bacterium]